MEISKRQRDFIFAALDIVNNHGFYALTIRSLAERVGVSEPAVYRHFKSKSDFFYIFLEYVKNEWETLLKKSAKDSIDGFDELTAKLHVIVEYFADNPGYSELLFSLDKINTNSKIQKLISGVANMAESLISEAVERAQKEGSIRADITKGTLTEQILGMVIFRIMMWKDSGRKYPLKKDWKRFWDSSKRLYKSIPTAQQFLGRMFIRSENRQRSREDEGNFSSALKEEGSRQ